MRGFVSRKYVLPGVVCWGDSLTAGFSGNVSYPSTLQKYIDTYLCDIYDFASTVDNAQDYSRLDSFEISPIRYAEGELKRGESHYEFYPEESSLWDMVRMAYCK